MGMHIFEGVRTTIFAALGGIGTRVIFGLPGRIGDGMIIFGIFEAGGFSVCEEMGGRGREGDVGEKVFWGCQAAAAAATVFAGRMLGLWRPPLR